MFKKAESRDDVAKKLDRISMMILFIALVYLGFNHFHVIRIYDGIICALLAGILLKWKSRIAAVSFLLYEVVFLLMFFSRLLGVTSIGPDNPILGFIGFVAAIGAVKLTYKLHGRFQEDNNTSSSAA